MINAISIHRFSWGKGIIILYGIFILGVVVMVYTSVTKNIDLVAPNYYDKEIKYQEQIDKINNTTRLEHKLLTSVQDGSYVIVFPDDDINEKNVTGEISFYRPSDAKKDFKLPVQLMNGRKQEISTAMLQKGLWKVSIEWSIKGVNYFSEEKIVIQ